MRVLVVEDDPDLGRQLSEALSQAGYAVDEAFDGEEGLSEHTAPYDALVIGVEGRAEIPVAGVPHIVGEGDSLLMPANIPHAVKPLGGFKMLLIMIRGVGQ